MASKLLFAFLGIAVLGVVVAVADPYGYPDPDGYGSKFCEWVSRLLTLVSILN
jgi:hypothetical protein